MDQIVLTPNGEVVLEFLQTHDDIWVGKDIMEMTGIKGIYPVLNSLIKKGLVEKDQPVTRDFTNNKGQTLPKQYETYKLTDFGRDYCKD